MLELASEEYVQLRTQVSRNLRDEGRGARVQLPARLTTSALSTTSVVNAGLGFGNRIWSLSEGLVYGHKTNATSAYTIADGGEIISCNGE